MYERMMGLNIVDQEMYQQYRNLMQPILKLHGGSFGYDFTVSEVLISKTTAPINRVFTIEFPDKESMEAFFSDVNYLEIKTQYLDNSIASKTVISMHEINN